MRYIVTGFFITLCLCISVKAQVIEAHIDDSGKVYTTELPHLQFSKNSLDKQAEPWPKSFVPDPSFKNFRGVCLEDINNDGKDEIITGINDTIYAFKGNGDLLWHRHIEGTAIYPPSSADIDGDGKIEIFLNTGGHPNNGRVYGFDHEGNVLDGWPLNFSNHWMICAPALADIDGDGNMEILTSERNDTDLPGKLHVLKADGTPFSDNWPQEIEGVPAVTPSAGTFGSIGNKAGNADIITCSTTGLYAFNADGSQKSGFPVENDSIKYSYQSPLLVHAQSPNKLFSSADDFITGANHGNKPGFYCMDTSGNMLEGYPVLTADSNWTYGPPTCFGNNCDMDFLLIGQPGATGEGNYPAIYYDTGNQNGFFERTDGLEGFITVMKCTNQSGYYVFTGSNMITQTGLGFIHAYHMVNTGTDIQFTELAGFPKMVPGFTFINGINLGDVDSDPYPELVVLSYETSGSEDSTYINVFDFDEQEYDRNKTYPTYKGDNSRAGERYAFECLSNNEHAVNTLSVYPNPVEDMLFLEIPETAQVRIYNITGHCVMQTNLTGNHQIPVSGLTPGIYIIKADSKNGKKHYGKFTKL
jgi:hypothetical protein